MIKEHPINYNYFQVYPKNHCAKHIANGNWVYWDNLAGIIYGENIPLQNFKDLVTWLSSQQAVHFGCG